MTEAPARVLVVEDEPTLAGSIRFGLEQEGFDVELVDDGAVAVDRFRRRRPDLVILDLMLPGLSGLDVCRIVRAESDVPIIIVTARDTEADKVAGLELGADDYVTKPFSVRELVSRVRAHLRRAAMGGVGDRSEVIEVGPVRLDAARHEVSVRGEVVAFPPKEFDLLETLMRRVGRLATREFLIERVWGTDYVGDTKTLDVHVKRIRGKIETDPGRPRHLLTVRGLGYKYAG